MKAVVELTRATRRYGRIAALQDVSLALNPGETVAVIGHNGAGKTTLMKLVLGLIRPSSGSVLVHGADPAGRKGARVRRSVGFVPESVAFHAAMTATELLSFYARLKGAPCEKNKTLLERVGLAEAAHRRVGTYSKGMRQRLLLAQALLGQPGLLLLDEPTSGLDPESRSQIYETIDQLRTEGATVMLSSHALAEIEHHVSRVALLHRGRLIAAGDLPTMRRQVSLPSRLRLTVKHCMTERVLSSLTEEVTLMSRGPDWLEFAVPETSKISLLREVTAMPDVVLDVEMKHPSLEVLYRHLCAEEDQ